LSWKGKKVLVTGADGFIGSHLAERLVREGAGVRAFVLYNSLGSQGWLDHSDPAVRGEMDVLPGDIRDADRVAEAAEGCEAVFHLAALISVPYSVESPESFIDTNVRGTLNALNAARKHGASRFVQTSSSEVYGTPKEVPIRETHPLQAQSPYAASKTAADQLAESFYCSYELPVVVLRPFNTYGPRQSARAVIPAILTQLLAGKEKISLGAVWPRRDFTYVDDTVEGFLLAASQDAAVGRTVQLGTGRDISIGELVELACGALGKRAEIESEDKRLRPEKGEVHRLLSDPSLAEELLGWTPKISLEEGIARTAEWLGKWLDHYDADQYLV
jgi:NAD dependent epimerase/dehydratase